MVPASLVAVPAAFCLLCYFRRYPTLRLLPLPLHPTCQYHSPSPDRRHRAKDGKAKAEVTPGPADREDAGQALALVDDAEVTMRLQVVHGSRCLGEKDAECSY